MTKANFADVLVALAVYERTGDAELLAQCVRRRRSLPVNIRAAIGGAFVARLRNPPGAGRKREPWQDSAALARAIAAAYDDALRRAAARARRAKDERTDREFAADLVRLKVEPFRRLKLTRSSVFRAVTAARRNRG